MDQKLVEGVALVAESVVGLVNDRDDMVVGITAVLLDIYRTSIERGEQTEQDVLSRLSVQRDELQKAGGLGVKYLDALIAALRDGKLDAAKLIRQPAAGTA
jgi:hypothetical protein